MSLVLDLRDVSARNRSATWQETIKHNYLDLDIRFKSDREPCGMIAQSLAGGITFASIASVAQMHERTTAKMGDDVDHLFGWMQVSGNARLDQKGRDTSLKPGDFLVMDAAQPYRAEFLDEYQIFAVRIPRVHFGSAFRANRDFINYGIGERQGSMVIVDYFRRVAKAYDGLSSQQRDLVTAQGVRLLVDMLVANV